jgi:NDP-sugar pyrophosphorylase family protein
MIKRAIILAGGIGSRLRPYTIVLPKPLMPVSDYSIIEIIIRQLSYYGFDHITVTISKKNEIIPAFLGDGSKWNVKIDYSVEEIPLSTMGPLKLIRDLPENFLIMNGDVLTDLDFNEFYNFHIKNGELFTISAQERTEKSEYGVLDLKEDSHLSGFREKPVNTYTVSMGIYMAKREILDYIPENTPFGFDHLMLEFLEKNKPVLVRKHNGYWLDIGRPADYNRAVDEFNEYKKKLLPGL